MKKVISSIVQVLILTFIVTFALWWFAPNRALPGGDADCNGRVDMSDVVSLVNYIFAGVPLPECRPAWRTQALAMIDSVLAEYDEPGTDFSWFVWKDKSVIQIYGERKK